MRQVGIRCRMSRVHLQSRVQDQTLAAGNAGQLEPIGGSLDEVVPRRGEELILRVAGSGVPADVHSVRTDEADLSRLRLERPVRRRSHHRHDSRTRTINHRSRMGQLLSWRCHVLLVVDHLLPVDLAADADDYQRPKGQKIEFHP